MKRVFLAVMAIVFAAGLPSCRLLKFRKTSSGAVSMGGMGGGGMAPSARGWALMYPEMAQGSSAAAASAMTQGADPGTPEGGMYDFSGVVQTGATAPSRVPWNRSAIDAAKKSRVTGKPLLILFTHLRSQPAQALENTLLLTPEFREMAEKEFVLLRIDYADEDTEDSDFYQDFKKRFKANGYPTIIVTAPDGTELSKISGYKSDWQARHLQSLKAAVISATRLKDKRRKSLEAEGYRNWKNKTGEPVFAKLTKLDANMGTFTGEWGESFNTFLTRLGDEDQEYIATRRKDNPL